MRRFMIMPLIAMTFVACSSKDSANEPLANASLPGSETTSFPSADSPIELSQGEPVTAAISYVASTDELMGHSPIGRREIFRKLVTPTQVAEQAAAFELAAAEMALTLAVPVERLVWVEAPLTATLIDSAEGSASVDVWSVSVLGSPDVGSPQQVWRTVRVELELLDEEWKVTGATAESGPTPAANELTLQSGWDDFERVAAWPAVVEGVGL